MKKILIFSHAMEIGGVERALLGLLETIDYTRYSVDLFLLRHEGELLKYIPKQVHLLSEVPQYASLAVPILNVVNNRQYKVALGRVIGKIKAKIREKELKIQNEGVVQLEYSHKYTRFAMPNIQGEYDFAISFLTPHYFVSEKVNARKKVAWIHTDYTKIKIDVESEEIMWSHYDYIVAISDAVAERFISVFPKLREKIVVVQNIMPYKSIMKQVTELNVKSEMLDDGSLKLLSIGRFCEAKNFDNVPAMCKLIRQKGMNVKWYLIGYGGDEELIREKIREFGMDEFVHVLGKKENPYPYIDACDIYIQPSRYEGNSVTVREAQLLNKPVLITNYATAKSQLKDSIDGVISEMKNELCAEKIAELICDRQLQQYLIENTKRGDYTNISEIKRIYEMFDEN